MLIGWIKIFFGFCDLIGLDVIFIAEILDVKGNVSYKFTFDEKFIEIW